MTLRELKDFCAMLLDDLQFGYFTQDQLTVWLNHAQKEVQKRLIKSAQNYFIECVQTNLVIGQRAYALPQDLKKIHRLEIITSGVVPNETVSTIVPMTINQQDMVPTGSGSPSWYFFKRNNVFLYPAPDSVLPLRMLYSYIVADMVLDTDRPDPGIHEEYHELIGLLACQDGFIKDERVPELLLKKISEYEKDFDNDAQDRSEDVSRSVVETGSSVSQGIFWMLACVMGYMGGL